MREPDDGKLSRPVPRGAGRGDAPMPTRGPLWFCQPGALHAYCSVPVYTRSVSSPAPGHLMHSPDNKSVSNTSSWQSLLPVIGTVTLLICLLLAFEYGKHCGIPNLGRAATQTAPESRPAERQPVQLYFQSNHLTMVQAHTNILHIDGHSASTGYSDGFLTGQGPGAAITAEYPGPGVGFSASGEADADVSEDNSEEE